MRTTTYATLTDEPQLTSRQLDYLSHQLTVELPGLMSAIAPIIMKESVKARDVNAHEVVNATSNAKTNDAANIDALQAKIDLDKALLEWSLRIAHFCKEPVLKDGVPLVKDGNVVYQPAGRPPHRQAVNIAKHLNGYLDWLAHYNFRGKNAKDFFNEVVRGLRRIRELLGSHGAEDNDAPALIVIDRDAVEVARNSGNDNPMTPREIVAVMNKAGYHNLKVDNIRLWASRGYLTPTGIRKGKSNMYLISDVMEICTRDGKKISEKAA